MLSGFTYPVWQFVVFFVLLYSYPDDDCKNYWNVLIMCNKTYFIHVHLLVLLDKFKSFKEGYAAALNHQFW